jgi:hypothetical protein
MRFSSTKPRQAQRSFTLNQRFQSGAYQRTGFLEPAHFYGVGEQSVIYRDCGAHGCSFRNINDTTKDAFSDA